MATGTVKWFMQRRASGSFNLTPAATFSSISARSNGPAGIVTLPWGHQSLRSVGETAKDIPVRMRQTRIRFRQRESANEITLTPPQD
jgi:hypothetical protein